MLSRSNLGEPFLWASLIAVVLGAAVCSLCFWGIVWHRGIPVEWGWEAAPRGNAWVIAQIGPAGPADGKLSAGDRIVAINGSDRAARFGPPAALLAYARPFSIDVVRNGARLHFTLNFWFLPNSRWAFYWYLLLACLNLGLAAWIGLARPDYAAARIAFILFLAIAITLAAFVLQEFRPPLSGLPLVLTLILTTAAWRPLEWAVAYDFAIRFPETLSQPNLLRIARSFFYTAGFLLWSLRILPLLADILHFSSRTALLPPGFPLSVIDVWRPIAADALGAAALLSVPLVLARNYAKLPNPIARRRLRWVGLAIAVAILPMALGITLRFLLLLSGHSGTADQVDSFINTVGSSATVLSLMAMTYAIIKHRVLGIRLVIRRGVQYLLARNVLRVILYLPLIAIAFELVLHTDEPLKSLILYKSWWFYVFIAGTAYISLRYRTLLQAWVDKRFFRSAYEEEVILPELIRQMQDSVTPAELARTVAEQLQRTFQSSAVYVLLKSKIEGRFVVAYPQEFALASGLPAAVDTCMQSTDTVKLGPSSLQQLHIAPELSDVLAKDLGMPLTTPISSASGEILGVLLLGEKRSEEVYSKRDRKLISAGLTQMALILDMLGLKEQVREEGRVRIEVLGRLDHQHIQLVVECPACGCCYGSPRATCEVDGSTLEMTLPIEWIIEGKYRLQRRIGTGGMGAVYQAWDVRLDRSVALKVISSRLFGNNVALRRFEREARAVAKLQHPNVVPIYDFGSLRGGGAYLVMQLIVGRSWRVELSRGARIAPARMACWLEQLCEAMAYAHANGVVHRDLKPENLLVSDSAAGAEKVTVLDFGLAKVYEPDQLAELQLSTEDAVLGTFGYMSPEQRTGQRIDARTDIYSIGVIIAECLTNSRPPLAGASREWLDSILVQEQPNEALYRLLKPLNRCIADLRSDRPSDVRELWHEIIPLLHGHVSYAGPRAATASGTPE